MQIVIEYAMDEITFDCSTTQQQQQPKNLPHQNPIV